MGIFAQPPFGADAIAVADDQHADHQLRINRRTPNQAVEIGEVNRLWRNARTLANHNPRVYKSRIVGNYLINGAWV